MFLSPQEIYIYSKNLVRRLSIPMFTKVRRVKTELASDRYWNFSVV